MKRLVASIANTLLMFLLGQRATEKSASKSAKNKDERNF